MLFRSEEDVLKGLIEDVRALYKEIAPTKETYAEKLKKCLSSSSTFAPSSTTSTTSPSPLSSLSPPTSSTSSTSTRGKKKQL